MFAVYFYSGSNIVDWSGPFSSKGEAASYADHAVNASVGRLDGWSIDTIEPVTSLNLDTV